MRRNYRQTRHYEASEIRLKLETDDYWLCRGLMAIYRFHQFNQAYHSHNCKDVKFTVLDARDLVPLAELCMQGEALTPLQIHVARPKMLKYAEKLAYIANGVVKLPKNDG